MSRGHYATGIRRAVMVDSRLGRWAADHCDCSEWARRDSPAPRCVWSCPELPRRWQTRHEKEAVDSLQLPKWIHRWL